jgi:short-subunit dehydrogenase
LRLAGARALLTGASGGIGAAIARALDGEGAELVLSARRTTALEELREALGGRAQVEPADLSEPDAPADLLARAGQVDLLVANAALPASGRLDGFAPEAIDRALAVNLRAPIQLARALLPGMVERGRGHLVFVGSLNGKVATAGSSLYSATKFGLRGMAAALREDLHNTGVGVSVVSPGFVGDVGMYAETGVELPRGVRTVSAEDVGRAVVRAVRRNRGEIDVAPLALRLGARAAGLAPGATAALQRRLGSHEIAERMARAQAGKR